MNVIAVFGKRRLLSDAFSPRFINEFQSHMIGLQMKKSLRAHNDNTSHCFSCSVLPFQLLIMSNTSDKER